MAEYRRRVLVQVLWTLWSRPCVADYRPETCAYCQADTWCEMRANGKPQCRACKIERFFARILYPPLGYRLLAWQRKVLRYIYGTVSPEDGRRRYRSAYISVGKKNGKSFLIGGLPLYHLLMEDERIRCCGGQGPSGAGLQGRRRTGSGQPASSGSP